MLKKKKDWDINEVKHKGNTYEWNHEEEEEEMIESESTMKLLFDGWHNTMKLQMAQSQTQRCVLDEHNTTYLYLFTGGHARKYRI